MTEMATRKDRLKQAGSSQPRFQENVNWLFICQQCGEPITFDESLVTWTQEGMVRVAHCRCAPDRCRRAEV
ncbi:MAG: hypothetical protein HPY54_07365 [Chthonomonadetes bacterium]|jgi:hypothetical protein|nr:hypothetical protein [Chthonomonadetes bacterium]